MRLLALAVTVLLPATAGAQSVATDFASPVTRVVTYETPGVVVARSALPLPDASAAAYNADFLGGAYYGAFAISKDGAFGYVTQANSVAAARQIALLECQRHASACIVYAEIVPEGHRDPAPGEMTLAAAPTSDFATPDKTRIRFRAMAASHDGGYSMVWGYASQAEADSAALADCTTLLITDLPDLPPMPCLLLPGLY
jgi:hypothetical protein